ncbi:glycolipid 2-alpha-mannosyltransferase-domain-containing protein [Polychytrium aggregatum]|uniref:glycolipid 2-alpha-mannosyltransferase-domain-containing protein n=1 Tax=Polychytrium aggregatum TaxID=110093 RepID=UPI0022FEBDC7|nr:glycolipid 2-alpha-mannosyltransferase-domain-containing protein [Polychytrium aggregatum]KAI9205883.1 glycolipid 2-alpha-mannosyltransferase-domain-containing protein [Polychytrium aggregatum]
MVATNGLKVASPLSLGPGRIGRENACIIALARNSDKDGILKTLRTFEPTFNARHRYPYIFFNHEPFNQEFKDAILGATNASVRFEVITEAHWSIPRAFSRKEVEASIKEQSKKDVNGGKESYHHMCRFYSGFFAQQEALKDFKYYWRIEPDVSFYCKLNYDPFELMRTHKKRYGFNIMAEETETTIPTLWNATLDYMYNRKMAFPPHLKAFEKPKDKIDSKSEYNLAHFWSNFEIGDLDFFRSSDYLDYFDYLDKRGGFFFERWGDAPVHSLAVGLFMDPTEVHYFYDIGYEHSGFAHCPVNVPSVGVYFDSCECNHFHTKEDWMVSVDHHFWNLVYKDYLAFLDKHSLELAKNKPASRQ